VNRPYCRLASERQPEDVFSRKQGTPSLGSSILGLTALLSGPILRLEPVHPRATVRMDAQTVSWEGETPMALNKANASEFEIKERQVGEVTVLELRGRVALGKGAQALNDKLQTLIDLGRIKLLLQCSEVTILDSQGISSLVRGVISMRKRGGQLKLLKLSPRAHRVLEITHLLTFIQSFEDEAEALASF